MPAVVVDASVLVSASRTQERMHQDSVAFLHAVVRGRVPVHAPALLFPEVAGALARPVQSPEIGRDTVSLIKRTLPLRIAPVDTALAERALDIACDFLLRGADAIYVALTAELRATLVTLDQEMLKRGLAVVPTVTPAEWLTKHPSR